jgi:hypothetical protein
MTRQTRNQVRVAPWWLSGLLGVSAALAAEPTAHDPHFSNKKQWPKLTGKEAFVSEKWDKARVLVWAHPGQSGNYGGRRALDGSDLANWIIDGKAGSGLITIDRTTDIVLPDADKRYTVTPHRRGRQRVRHVTIGRNATLGGGYTVYGNVWVREWGKLGARTAGLLFTGPEHTFVRNENKPRARGGEGGFGQASEIALAHYIGIAKLKGSSLEFLGTNASSDELVVHEGTVIIGPDSSLYSGYTSTSIIGPDAVLELQSGAMYGRRKETWMGVDLMVQGELRGGSPQRPLAKDATLRLTLAQYKRANEDDRRKIPYTNAYSAVIHKTGKVRIHSKQPDKARLVFTSAGQKIKLAFLGDVQLDGVLFDFVKKGGIHLADLAAAARWKHVAYGPNNQGTPEALVCPYDAKADATLRRHERDNYRGRVPR